MIRKPIKPDTQAAWCVGFIVVAVVLYYFPDLAGAFAWPWTLSRPDIIGWWTIRNEWYWVAFSSLVLSGLICAFWYSSGLSERSLRVAGICCVALCICLFTIAGRARIEFLGDGVRVTSVNPHFADASYRVEHAGEMWVECAHYRRGGDYPSLWVRFFDARELELQRLTSRAANPDSQLSGLHYVERLDDFLTRRGNRQLVRPRNIDPQCVRRTARRLGVSTETRVARLFRSEDLAALRVQDF